MHGSARHLNRSGEGGSYYPLLILDATEPVPTPINLVVFITIIFVLRVGGVGRRGNPLPQLDHEFLWRLAPGGDSRYNTGKENPWEVTVAPIVVAIIVNNVIPDRMQDTW